MQDTGYYVGSQQSLLAEAKSIASQGNSLPASECRDGFFPPLTWSLIVLFTTLADVGAQKTQSEGLRSKVFL